ncbi:zinc finger protein 131-like [Anoplophora glabripennis]|uniref:zinc finger protein 131-like n=1 Tax=Anoplophora glabripennis TaxID=217634 RepID=UPI000873D37E|nr:zinc finger protein 131-like [Anoplophora glabripennis]
MSDQQFVLRWHYHETTLVHNLPCLLESDILTDVTLSVGTQHVKAHKIILAMCSVYFLQLFQEMKTTHPVVVLHNVSIDDIRAILSFVYRGQCVVSQEQLPSLLSVAKLLKIQGLCDMKVPEKQVQNEVMTNETDYIHEKISNEERFDNFNYNVRLKEPKQTESIELKRQSNDRVPIQDLCSESRIYSQSTHFHEKTVPVAKQHDPFKYDDQSYVPSPRKNPPKDSSETCKCFLCGKYLSNQYNLRVHMETHEEAYHACQSCPHVSRSRDALRKHVSYRHPEEYHTRKRKKTDSL